MIAIRRFGVEPNAIETIFITHLHGDHFGGLPFFFLDAQLVTRRTTPLTVAGPPGLRERLREAMEVLFPGSADIARRFQVEAIELDPGTARYRQWCHCNAVSDKARLRCSTVRAPPGM
jgi:ribonuclease BN (tRNA processing enzyme)